MWSMIVAVGIAAAWFEYSYRRNRRSKKDAEAAQNPAAKKNPPVAAAPAEQADKPLKAASSND